MKSTLRFILLPLILLAASWPYSVFASISNKSPQVVASITPFYNLVASIMEGVGTPKLLVRLGASPHDYALRPSDIQMLKEADVVFWAGPTLETFLVKPLNSRDLKPHAKIVQFDQTPGLLLMPVRQSPNWESCGHSHGSDDHGHAHHHHSAQCAHHDQGDSDSANKDMHFWLDPNNAQVLIDSIVKHLSLVDPEHKNIYQKNGTRVKAQLKEIDQKIKEKLKSVKTIPFIVFHDAYQYFEHHYGLNGVGAITLHPEVPPSVQRIATIRETIQKTHAACVFTEPQFQPKLVQSITRDTGVHTGELDPLGTIPKNGANGYFVLLENLADSLSACLSKTP
jgi:zinc transport system substrate-binding protein